jgi:hypothetical protein
MTFFLGTKGAIRLRRGTGQAVGALEDQIIPDDVNTVLNRIGFEKSLDNILTGDRISIQTSDSRGLICFPANTWSNNTVNNQISAYVNVNSAGGLRFFRSFADAVNNVRANELPVAAFSGAPIPIRVSVRDTSYNLLGCVNNYEFSTDRNMIDTTALDDKFKQMWSAGLISGSGKIDCAFNYQSSGATEPSLVMLQLIQRLDIGSEFDLQLYLTDKSNDSSVTSVYYSMTAAVTRAGVSVQAGQIIDCSIDFVSTDEVRLLVGEPVGFVITTEAGDPLEQEQNLDDLLTQETD